MKNKTWYKPELKELKMKETATPNEMIPCGSGINFGQMISGMRSGGAMGDLMSGGSRNGR